MAEYVANAQQVVNPGETVVFETAAVPCQRGFVRWRPGSGNFLLSGWCPNTRRNNCNCPCRKVNSADYLVDFGANIAVPTGETVGEISVAIVIDGSTIPATTMTVTPAAVEEFFNVFSSVFIDVPKGCCMTVSVRNIGDEAIDVINANLIVERVA